MKHFRIRKGKHFRMTFPGCRAARIIKPHISGYTVFLSSYPAQTNVVFFSARHLEMLPEKDDYHRSADYVLEVYGGPHAGRYGFSIYKKIQEMTPR